MSFTHPSFRRGLRCLGMTAAVALVCAPPRPTGACSCAPNHVEVLTLEILSVTQDGAPVANTAPWANWVLSVSGARDGAIVAGRRADNGSAESSWRFYVPAR